MDTLLKKLLMLLGVDSLCYDPLWHGCAPSKDMEKKCFSELDRRCKNV
jgi:hypothetical protein